jgi:hypothetical protein
MARMKETEMTRFLIIGLMAISLQGCAALSNRDPVVPAVASNKTLEATGYSRFDDSGKLNVNHRWLSAQQVAKLNAYRGLADQLYYEPLDNNKTVGSQVMSHEIYRVYLDVYLRSAKATDYRTVKDSLKTTLTLNLTPEFYQCMRGSVSQASQCLHEDDRMAFSRLGYKTATTTTANLACSNLDCSDQFAVQGFSKNRNQVDDFLLDAGLYDTEWMVNTGARTFFNYLLINSFVNGFASAL